MVVIKLIFFSTCWFLILSLRLGMSVSFSRMKLTMVGQLIYYIYFQSIKNASSSFKDTKYSSLKYDLNEVLRFVFYLHYFTTGTPCFLEQTVVQRSPSFTKRMYDQSAEEATSCWEVISTMMCLKNLLRLLKSTQFQFRMSPLSFLKSILKTCLLIKKYYKIKLQQLPFIHPKETQLRTSSTTLDLFESLNYYNIQSPNFSQARGVKRIHFCQFLSLHFQ